MAVLEDRVNLPLCGLFLILVSLMCFDAFSAVTVQYALKYSCLSITTRYTSSYLFDPRQSCTQRILFALLVNFRVSFRREISILTKYSHQTYLNVKMCVPVGTKPIE
jgi:hypothetical protein